MTIENGKVGYNRAIVLMDDKVKAVQDYVNKNAAILNSGKPIKNNLEIDKYFNSYGTVYDIGAFLKFYPENHNKYHPDRIKGILIDKMTSISVNNEPSTKSFLKNLPSEVLNSSIEKKEP